MAAEVAAHESLRGLGGDVASRDHRQRPIAVDSAAVDSLRLDQRYRGEEVVDVEGRAQHEEVDRVKAEEEFLELAQAGRDARYVRPVDPDRAQHDDMPDRLAP